MSRIDSISKALETEHAFDMSNGRAINVAEATNTVNEINKIANETTEYKDEDLEEVKANTKRLISMGMDLAEDMCEIVRISESPKAFDSAGAFLKSLAVLNEKLLNMGNNNNKPTNNQSTPASTNIQQNNYYTASPNDVFEKIRNKK